METSLGKKYITQLGPKPQDFADWFDLFWNTYVSDILCSLAEDFRPRARAMVAEV